MSLLNDCGPNYVLGGFRGRYNSVVWKYNIIMHIKL